jgi:sialate O-acetylesterase
LYGPAEKRVLQLADGTSIPLDNAWRYELAPRDIGPAPRAPWETTGGLTTIHNAMIAPLAPYTLRGVLWYQGEANTEEAEGYEKLLAGMMADWREEFGAGLPFLIVELSGYGPAATAPTDSEWAKLREAQRMAVAHDAHAGLAVAVDIGDRYDIHPANKQEVGKRLARAARHVVYGEQVGPSGPTPRGVRRVGDRVVVEFGDVDGKLVAYGARGPVGFELCAQDQASCRFVDASIDGSGVSLRPAAADVTPTRVRYCWADSPVCTLFDDRSGLPAGPFEVAIQ